MSLKLLPIIALVFISAVSNAQSPYSVSVSTAPYAELTADSPLTFLPPPENGYYSATNFIFPVFNNRSANFNLKTSAPQSLGAFVASQGYMAVYESPAYANTIAFQCLENNDSFSTVAGVTRVSTKMEGTTGNRILKYQWKDVVFNNNVAQTANFQVWLHEADKSISYHYGPNSVPNAATLPCYAGIIVINQSFTGLVDQFSLSGNPAAPQKTFGGTSFNFGALDGIPVPGTVYTLHNVITGIDELNSSAKNISVYPNPASSYITVIAEKAGIVSLLNSIGQIVNAFPVVKDKTKTIDLSNLPNGQYFVADEQGETSASFIISR
jgi:hypothetical protein